mgnify:CR=1 FL=1
MVYRELTIEDIPTLKTIDGSLTSNSKYSLVRSTDDSGLSYKLKIEQVGGPFNFPANYSCEEGDESQYRVMLSDPSGWGMIALDEGSVAGFCLCQEQAVTRSFYIEGLFVDRSLRGQGIGKSLISLIIKEARMRKLESVWLKTENTNMPACQFYQNCGFRITGIKENLSQGYKGRQWDFAIFWGLEISK